jgi:hypothetical protein
LVRISFSLNFRTSVRREILTELSCYSDKVAFAVNWAQSHCNKAVPALNNGIMVSGKSGVLTETKAKH